MSRTFLSDVVLNGLLKGLSGAAGDMLVHNGTSWARYAAGTNGHVLTLVSGAPAWQAPSGGGVGVKGEKTSSQNFTSTTLANVTSLSVSVAANTVYWLSLRLIVVGSASTTGLKLAWTYPSGTTILWNGMYDLNTGGGFVPFNSDPSFATLAAGLSESTTGNFANDTTTRPLLIGGIVHISSTSGTLQLQAARHAGSGTATINEGTLVLI